MERPSQREKAFALDYLTQFQLASSSLMSGQSPMEQVFQTFNHHTPNSTSGQMTFQAPQPTYGHPAGQQYHVASSYGMSMAERYQGVPYSQPYVNEDYFSPQCPPPSAHVQSQPYSGALPSSTPPMPPPMQSPQLSPMMRAQCQSPQHSPVSMLLHSKASTTTRAAPVNSPQSSVFNAQLHSPQQHYNSTLGGPSYYQTSQCSQRNDPPVGNMHMTKINSLTFNQTNQFSAHSQSPSSSQPGLRTLHSASTRLVKDGIRSAQAKKPQPSVSRPAGRDPNMSILHQTLSSNYLSSLAHPLQPRPSVAGASGAQSRFQPSMSMAPVRAPSASSASSTGYRKQNPPTAHLNAAPISSKSSMAVNFDANFPRSLQSDVYGRKKSVNQVPSSVSSSNANPYNVYSIFSLNGQPAREGVRGKAETAIRGRSARPEDRRVTIIEDMTPINWYKNPLMASSYSSDIEAMQADIIMESMMPAKVSKQPLAKDSGSVQQPIQKPPRAHGPPLATRPPDSGQLAPSLGPRLQSLISQQLSSGHHSSNSASKSAALAAIRVKQEQAESLSKNRYSKTGSDGSESVAVAKAPEKQTTASSSNISSINIVHLIGTLPTETYSSSLAKNNYIDNQKDCAIKNNRNKPNSHTLDPSLTSDTRDRNYPTISDLSNNVRKKMSNTAINGKCSNKGENFLEHQKPSQPNSSHANSLIGLPLQLSTGQHVAGENRQEKKQLSSMKKALDLWKAGQVVGRAPAKCKAKDAPTVSSNMPDKIPAVTSINNAKLSDVPLEKDTHLQGTEKSGSASTHLVPDGVRPDRKVPQGVRTKETTLDFHFVMLHDHKLVCLKSKNETAVLLCQFLSECFPDKGVGSLNNCIDRALRIKKRCLDHTKKSKICNFLEKNGYSISTVQTINLDDARRVYHYIYKLMCNTSTCIVKLSHQEVDLDSLSMPARSIKCIDMDTRIKKEKSLAEDAASKRKESGENVPEHFLNCVVESHDGKDTDAHSIGSDHKSKVVDDDLILVEAFEDPNIITLTPGIPKAGGICNTVVGSVRYYQHNKENYLVVEDLCNIFSAPVFYHTVEEESIVLYSCSDEITDFLNTIRGTFPPLSSPQQSLIKEADVGALIIEDGNNAGIQEEKSGSMKRPICKQEKPDEYESTPKKLRVEESILASESYNLPASNRTSAGEDENSQHFEPAREIPAGKESQTLQQSSENLSKAKSQTSGVCESLHEKTLSGEDEAESDVALPGKDSEVPQALNNLSHPTLANNTTEFLLDQVTSVLDSEPSKVARTNEQDAALAGNVHCTPETTYPMPEAKSLTVPAESKIKGKSQPLKPSYYKSKSLRLKGLNMRRMLLKTSAHWAKERGKLVTTKDTSAEVVKSCNSGDFVANSVVCCAAGSTTYQQEAQLETIRESYSTDAVTDILNADAISDVLSSSNETVIQFHKPQAEKASIGAAGLAVRPETVDRAAKAVEVSCEVDSSEAAHVSSSVVKVLGQSEVVLRACDSSVNKSQSVSSTTSIFLSSACFSAKKSFDDLSIITSSMHGSLAARPSSQFSSLKSICEGYDKLCFQNKSLLQFAHLLRKELAANKDKAEKEMALNKEMADMEIARLKDIIKQITSGFKDCDEQAPILIDDDDCE